MDKAVVILLSFSMATGFDYGKRCLLYGKQCVSHCPRLMHPYHTRCDKDTVSQRTCDSPQTYPLGFTCGWSRCDCNGDLLLDETIYQCVEFSDCPVPVKRKRKTRKRKPNRLPKKIKVPKNDDFDMK